LSARHPAQRPLLWCDCDTGLDDALALLLAAGAAAGELVGVSTVAGNCPLAQATGNTLRVLELAGRGAIPVHAGAAGPLVGAALHARHVHGDDGLGGCAAQLPAPRARARPEPAAVALARVLRALPGRLTVVATGPLTNLALVAALDPGAAALARHVVIMGGTVHGPGNVGPVTEFNLAADPEAARAVLSAAWPVTVVGLDVTHRVALTRAHADQLEAAGRPVPAFAAALVRAYVAAYEAAGHAPAAPMHDPLAVAVALRPDLVRTVELPADVETRGELTRGMLVADRRVLERPPLLQGRRTVSVCTDVDAGAAVDHLLGGWSAG
jgi:purine nucleosidase